MDADSIAELFHAFGPVLVKRMFGGYGVYCGEVMFALVADGVIYLKADESSAPDFERENCGPFVYAAKNGKRAVMSYWRMPDRLYDDPDELARWASVAFKIAQINDARKKTGAREKRSKTRAKKAATRLSPG